MRRVKKLGVKRNWRYRIIASGICMVMVLSMIFQTTAFSAAEETKVVSKQDITRTADTSTINDWQQFFGEETDTSNAGRIWTDKTVADGNIQLKLLDQKEKTIERTEDDNFLVGLSALSSNKTVIQEAVKPVDVMLVLDISGSMENEIGGEAKIVQLVRAANSTIQDILDMNPQNRVGVVLFSGGMYTDEPSKQDTAFCPLPLDRYTTNNKSYFLLEDYYGIAYRIKVDPQVKNSSGDTVNAENKQYAVQGLTYIQNGLMEALSVFENSVIEPESDEERIPVITLMTDGSPTAAKLQYADRGDSDIQTGNNTDIRLAFLTQLTAAWVKKNLKETYQVEPLVYTVGVVGRNSSEAKNIRMVLNPRENNTTEMNSWWDQFLQAKENVPIRLEASGMSISVVKTDTRLQADEDRYYVDVDGYFEVNEVDGIEKSFEELVERIERETAESPIENEQTGTLAFEDRIGEYMNVAQMTGIMYGDELHQGSTFAEKMNCDADILQEEKEEVLDSIMEKIKIDRGQAETLLMNAQDTGQISYTSQGEFSNYIAWYANKNGEYLAPYRSGEAPVEGAEFLNRSYFYYGNTSENYLLRVDAKIEENLTTKEQIMKFSVPASLLPLVKYKVVRDATNSADSITEKMEAYPIQLFYEVALRSDINAYDLNEIDSGYSYLENTETAKTAVFYTNTWQKQGAEAKTTAGFTLSEKNEYYYYTKDTPVYVRNETGEYELYTGGKPEGNDGRDYYYKKTVYGLNGGEQDLTLSIDKVSLNYAKEASDGSGEWVIPQGTFRYEMMQTENKSTEGNKTETVDYVRKQVLETADGAVKEFLGNNGKIKIQQGKIAVSKTVRNDEFLEGDNENTEFHFEIDLKLTEGEKVPDLISGEKNGNKVECPVEGGKIKFTLKTTETIEFWLPDGEDVSVEEVGEHEQGYVTFMSATQHGEIGKSEQTKKVESVEIETKTKSAVDVINGMPSKIIWIYKSEKLDKPLEGAVFALYRLKCTDSKHHTDEVHNQVIKKGEQIECWEFISEATSMKNGYLAFKIGDYTNQYINGTYRFVEVEAPVGYITPVGQWNMYVNHGSDEPIIIEDVLGPNGEKPPAVGLGEYRVSFYNYKPLNPPITGGRGIWHYLLLGAVVTCGGIGLGICQTRRRKHGNS